MNKRRTSTLLAVGLLSTSLLISPLAFATQGTSERSGTAVVGQQTKPHTGGQKHKVKGKRAKKKSAKPQGTSAM